MHGAPLRSVGRRPSRRICGESAPCPGSLQIALVITELEVGGAERCLVNLACGLDRDRFAVTVLLPGDGVPRRPKIVWRVDSKTHISPSHFLGFASKWSLPAAVRSLRAAFDRQRPDVVQSMLFHANVVSGLARRLAGTGALSLGFRVADPSRWRQWVEGRIARRAQRIVCVSQSVADFAARQMGIGSGAAWRSFPTGLTWRPALSRRPADLTRFGVAARPAGHHLHLAVWPSRKDSTS